MLDVLYKSVTRVLERPIGKDDIVTSAWNKQRRDKSVTYLPAATDKQGAERKVADSVSAACC